MEATRDGRMLNAYQFGSQGAYIFDFIIGGVLILKQARHNIVGGVLKSRSPWSPIVVNLPSNDADMLITPHLSTKS